MQFSTVRLKRSYRFAALFQRKNKNNTKFKILFRFDEFSWGSIAGVFVVLDVLWGIMQCSLKQTESPSFSKNLKRQFCSSRLFQFHIVFFFLSFFLSYSAFENVTNPEGSASRYFPSFP